jgi:hypothetical protein
MVTEAQDHAGRGALAWGIGLAALALLIWALAAWLGNDEPVPVGAVEEPAAAIPAVRVAPAAIPLPVNEYFAWVDTHRAPERAELLHEYAAAGLLQFSFALNALVVSYPDRGVVAREELERLRAIAARLREIPAPGAAPPREAFLIAAAVMEAMQEAYFREVPEIESAVARVVRTATSLPKPGDPPDGARVEQFFEQAAQTLRLMVDRLFVVPPPL